MKQQYITAVLEMINSGTEPAMVLSGLQSVLKKRGHERLAPSVLAGVLRILEARSIRDSAVLVVARESDVTAHQEAITAALKSLKHDGSHEIQIDSSLIGGFVASVGNTVIDSSYKTTLINLYRRITN